MINDSYLTISDICTSEIKVKKSRFIANAFPLRSLDETSRILKNIRKQYFDAKHHPYSFVMHDQNIFRFNDDGEPSGSSGKPIFEAINKHNLKNIIVVVSRYFGGIKLGVGGLKRAYFDSAEECLKICKFEEIILKDKICLSFPYKYISNVMKKIEKDRIDVLENNSRETVNLVCNVRKSLIGKFMEEIIEITNGSVNFD